MLDHQVASIQRFRLRWRELIYSNLSFLKSDSKLSFRPDGYSRVTLIRGDFSDNSEIPFSTADFIYVNNIAFDAATNLILVQRFLELKEGAKVCET